MSTKVCDLYSYVSEMLGWCQTSFHNHNDTQNYFWNESTQCGSSRHPLVFSCIVHRSNKNIHHPQTPSSRTGQNLQTFQWILNKTVSLWITSLFHVMTSLDMSLESFVSSHNSVTVLAWIVKCVPVVNGLNMVSHIILRSPSVLFTNYTIISSLMWLFHHKLVKIFKVFNGPYKQRNVNLKLGFLHCLWWCWTCRLRALLVPTTWSQNWHL